MSSLILRSAWAEVIHQTWGIIYVFLFNILGVVHLSLLVQYCFFFSFSSWFSFNNWQYGFGCLVDTWNLKPNNSFHVILLSRKIKEKQCNLPEQLQSKMEYAWYRLVVSYIWLLLINEKSSAYLSIVIHLFFLMLIFDICLILV